MFTYPIYNHNWRNIITIYIYITRLASKEIFSASNKTHLEVGRAKDLSAPLYKSTAEVYVSGLQDAKAPHQTRNLKTTATNTTGSNHCLILLSS